MCTHTQRASCTGSRGTIGKSFENLESCMFFFNLREILSSDVMGMCIERWGTKWHDLRVKASFRPRQPVPYVILRLIHMHHMPHSNTCYVWDTTHSNTHSHVWHDSFKYSFTCATRLIPIRIHTCDTTNSNTHTHVWHDSFTYSFTCVTRLILWLRIYNCDITHSNTHSYVRHDLCVEQYESLKKVDQEKKAGQSSSGSAIMRHGFHGSFAQ